MERRQLISLGDLPADQYQTLIRLSRIAPDDLDILLSLPRNVKSGAFFMRGAAWIAGTMVALGAAWHAMSGPWK
jgi:hypothetical protein